MRTGQRGLQLGDPGVPLGEFGAQAVQDVVDVGHPVTTDGHRKADGVDIGAGHRAVLRQRVEQPVRLGIPQPPPSPPPTTTSVTAATTTTIAISKNQNTTNSPDYVPALIVPCGCDS